MPMVTTTVVIILLFSQVLQSSAYIVRGKAVLPLASSPHNDFSFAKNISRFDIADRNNRFNIVYIKTPKAASSTVGGIIRRIAAHHHLMGVDCEEWPDAEPGISAHHSTFRYLMTQHYHRFKLQTYVLAFVRDPIARCISHYYHFQVSRKNEMMQQTKQQPEHILDFIQSKECQNFLANYLKVDTSSHSPNSFVTSISNTYNFIGVAERFDESVVALAYDLKLSLCDILYISAKNSSQMGTTDGQGTTFVTAPKFDQLPKSVRSFIQSDKFKESNQYEYELLAYANSALDSKIRAIGAGFRFTLATYRRISALAHERCAYNISAFTRSGTGKTDNGTNTGSDIRVDGSPLKCYWNDNGCGYDCLDDICRESDYILLPVRGSSTH